MRMYEYICVYRYVAQAWVYVHHRAAHAFESVHKCHSGNHLLSQSNHILIAAVKDVATCSPTGSKLQRVPVDLLDMWAICLPVVAWVSLLSIDAQIHTKLFPSTCAHHHTHRSPLNVTHTHTASQWRVAIWRFGVGFLHLSGPSLPCDPSLRDKSPRPKHISSSVCLKPRNQLLHVQEHERKNGAVREKRGKSVIRGLIVLIAISKHSQNLDSKWKPQFNLYIFP